MEAGARFCPKCGAQAPAAAVTPSVPAASPAAPTPVAATAPAAQAGGGNALKIILIVLAVIVGLGILCVGGGVIFIHHAISRTHVTSRSGEVKVETPFGTVESTEDAGEASKNLGVDVYPGATVVKNSSANMNFGSVHTSAAEFESGDPPDKVADYYRSRLPQVSTTSSADGHYSLIAGNNNNLITINIEPHEGKTHIHIAHVVKPGP